MGEHRYRYNSQTDGEDGQPIFIDLIVKTMLNRVYVNLEDKRVLTAEKILGNAESILQ